MIHPDQIQSSNKSNHGSEDRKQGEKQKLKKKGPMEVFNIYIVYKKKQKDIYIIPKIFQRTPNDVLTLAADVVISAQKVQF